MSRRRSASQVDENVRWHLEQKRRREEASRAAEAQRRIPEGYRRVSLEEIFDELPVVSGY